MFTLMYAAVIVYCAVYEAKWLIDFDPENGAPIAFVTALVTAPMGWLGGALATVVSNALDLSDDADTVVVWSSMALFGLLQAWFVWRLGMSVGSARRRASS